MTTIDSAENSRDLEALRIARPQARSKRGRQTLGWAAFLILAAIGIGTAAREGYLRTAGRPTTVETFAVEARRGGPPGVLLTGSGYVVTRHKYITIGTKILGQIVAEPIEEGQQIKQGDVLAQIDDRDYQAQLRQAIASHDLAEANIRLSRAKAERARKLVLTGAISQEEYETAINGAEVAQAELKRDEAAVDYAKFQVSQCVIISPINGIILKKYRELGDTINYGGQIQAGGGATDIAQLADTEDMRAEVDINEADIAKVGMGSPATIVLDAYPDRRFAASLVKVYPEADRQKGTVKVEVQISEPDRDIVKPEMSVKASFLENRPVAETEPRMTIPKGAVKIEKNEAYVWLVRAGVVRRTAITRGRETETGIEIKVGLKDGDVVVIASPAELSEGGKVASGGMGSTMAK